MFRKYLCWLIALPLTFLLGGCAVVDDIPYPFIESSIMAIEVEGQCDDAGNASSSAVINNAKHTVQLYVDETVDLSRVSIKRLEVSNEAQITVTKGAVNADRFPKTSFKETPDAEATRVDFTEPVQFTLTTYQDYPWTVSATQVLRGEANVFARCTSATISGELKAGYYPAIEYREQGSAEWKQLLGGQMSNNKDTYKYELDGLTPGTTYEYSLRFGNSPTSYSTFTTAPAIQLPNSSFDDWSSEGSGTRTLWLPKAEGDDTFWDTGNRGATTVGASNSTGVIEGDRTFANLQSKYIVVKFAAGNIFSGDYIATDGTNGILGFGRDFTSFPTKLQFDYKFKTSPVNRGGKWEASYGQYIDKAMFDGLKGQNDPCQIYVALLDDYVDDADREANTHDGKVYPWLIRTKPSALKLFDPQSPRIIAYGQLTQNEDVNDWTTETITLDYRYTDRKPKYILIVASSSKYGDYFTGGDKTLLQLDNLKLIYE